MVRFDWPLLLPALLAVPLLLAWYVRVDRRRRRQSVTWSDLGLVRAAAPRTGRRRHVPVGLMLASLAVLGLGTARPQVRVDVPESAASVILAIDVSGSMCSTDVEPNRLGAAQAAVKSFVGHQNSHVRIGLVAFAGFAQLAVAPTTDHDQLIKAVDSLSTGRGTTIGAAILKSVDAIAQVNPAVTPVAPDAGGDAANPPPAAPATPAPAPVRPPGGYVPEIVVLLTDGANTAGPTPVDAARIAATRGVRVFPIGFGTTHPTSMSCTAEQLGGSAFDNGPTGGFFGGGPVRPGFLVTDEPTLKQVATITGGSYFAAKDAGQLQGVFDDLPRHVKVQQRTVELSAGLAGLAILLVLAAAGAAVRWGAFPR